jgi:hypothetical protein
MHMYVLLYIYIQMYADVCISMYLHRLESCILNRENPMTLAAEKGYVELMDVLLSRYIGESGFFS